MDKKQLVLDIVKKFVDEGIEVKENDMLDEIGIDSMKKVNVIVECEAALDTEFDDADLNPLQITKVQDLVDLANKY